MKVMSIKTDTATTRALRGAFSQWSTTPIEWNGALFRGEHVIEGSPAAIDYRNRIVRCRPMALLDEEVELRPVRSCHWALRAVVSDETIFQVRKSLGLILALPPWDLVWDRHDTP